MPVWWCWKGHLSCFSQWRPFSFPTQAVRVPHSWAGTLWEAGNLCLGSSLVRAAPKGAQELHLLWE